MYHRYFEVKSGPLLKAVADIIAKRQEVIDTWKVFVARVGAKDVSHWTDGRIAGLSFETAPDRAKWSEMRGGWWPKKNTREGKALRAEMETLPKMPVLGDALGVIGLINMPVLIDGHAGYRPVMGWHKFPDPGVVFIKVPWREADLNELAEYKAQRESEHPNHFSMELDHLLWQPMPEMVEVKEWEFLRDMEASNNTQKQQEQEAAV